MGLIFILKEMKKIIITTLILFFFNINLMKAEGPLVKQKLIAPTKEKKQTLQKRTLTWIEGQWEIVNNKYEWIPAHWTKKRIGYVFVSGKWIEKNNGWRWKEGYWKKISLNKWMSLYN